MNPYEILQPILGKPHREYSCWQVARYLYEHLFETRLPDSPASCISRVREIWYIDEEKPLCPLQPWDLIVFRIDAIASNHVGVMLDQDFFATSTKSLGVCKSHVARWQPYILQIARPHLSDAWLK